MDNGNSDTMVNINGENYPLDNWKTYVKDSFLFTEIRYKKSMKDVEAERASIKKQHEDEEQL